MKTLCVAVFVLGDLIVLKNGETREGVYVGEDDQAVRWRDASGQMHVEPKSTVQSVKRAVTQTNVYEAIASTLSAERPADYYYLCAWAEEQGLKPPVARLCRVAAGDEEVRGRALFKLGGVVPDAEEGVFFRAAVASDPPLARARAALEAPRGGGVALPTRFASDFSRIVETVLQGRYTTGLSSGRRALAGLDAAQRENVESAFRHRTGMTLDEFLSRLAKLSESGTAGPGVCTYCGGTGYLPCTSCGGRGWKECAACGGKGYKVRSIVGPGRDIKEIRACGACRGTGRVHCRVCVPLKEYVNEEYTVGFPSTERKYVHFPGAELVSSVTGGTTTYTTSYQGRVSRSTYTRTPHVDGAVVKFTQKYSGRRRCPHCMKKTKKKDGVKRFTLDEMEGLNRLAREWKADAGRMRGGWQEGRKLRSFREGETGLDLKREQATAFYQGKWFTEGMRKMHFSVTGQKKIKADTSKFERWKADHKCRMVAEDAIDIPAEKEAWTGLFELYLMMGNSPSENRFASRQVFHAAFRGVRGEVSVFSPGGEFLAIAAEPELVLEPDRQVKTQAVGKVELWFRVRGAEPGRLRVTVLAARSGGKTVPFF